MGRRGGGQEGGVEGGQEGGKGGAPRVFLWEKRNDVSDDF
jgi:hypothetical protein